MQSEYKNKKLVKVTNNDVDMESSVEASDEESNDDVSSLENK
jgi:hypothetical protein